MLSVLVISSFSIFAVWQAYHKGIARGREEYEAVHRSYSCYVRYSGSREIIPISKDGLNHLILNNRVINVSAYDRTGKNGPYWSPERMYIYDVKEREGLIL